MTFIMTSAGDYGSPEYQNRADNIILIGANRVASSFIQLLRAYAPRRQPVIALLDADSKMIGRAVSGVQVLATPEELDAIVSEFSVHGISTQRVIIAGEADLVSPPTLREIEHICARRNIDLSYLPRMMGLTEWTQPSPVIVSQVEEQASFIRPSFIRVKRAIDVIGSLTLIVLLLPLLVMGPVISARALTRIKQSLDTALGEGARLVTGGGRPPGCDRGHFLAPTVLDHVQHEEPRGFCR